MGSQRLLQHSTVFCTFSKPKNLLLINDIWVYQSLQHVIRFCSLMWLKEEQQKKYYSTVWWTDPGCSKKSQRGFEHATDAGEFQFHSSSEKNRKETINMLVTHVSFNAVQLPHTDFLHLISYVLCKNVTNECFGYVELPKSKFGKMYTIPKIVNLVCRLK